VILNNKSIVLHSLAELLGGKECIEVLRTAIACCDNALGVFTYEAVPDSWAMVQSNKGDGLRHLARWLGEAERTEAVSLAIACYDAALTVYTRETASGDWARTQNNKGVALRSLARLQTGTERVEKLRAAIACYDEALLERQREVMPFDWAATQSSKGNALSDLAELLNGEERVWTLRAALACFDGALQERRREVSPGNWAKIQNSKGVTLRHLARLLEKPEQGESLQRAIACFDDALLECRREDAPVDWAMIQSNKGVVLSDMAELREGAERLKALEGAVACFDAALLVYRRDVAPVDWALAQSNKGNVLCDWAQMLDSKERIQMMQAAVSCIDAALTVYTREVLPVDHRRIAQSMGMLLFKEGDWQNAARYLVMALDALDDLFTLEVTAYGRQATLVSSADLTAHLAYALTRVGGDANSLLAAEALERGRARATGEAVARQEAQIAAAERLAPELLERFRMASNHLAMLTLKNNSSATVQEMARIAGDTIETSATPELVAIRAMNEQLAGYEEARSAHAAYDEVVALIRQEIPDFLRPGGLFEAAAKELTSDERLAYVATTPAGAVTLLIEGSGAASHQPVVKGWWDEHLTSTQVAKLLVGPPRADGKVQRGNGGLLAVSSRRRQLRRVLGLAMQTLGARDGVFAELSMCCSAAHVRRLVLIPCGLLGLLPLHAVEVPCAAEGEITEPLIDVVQVSYAPSARIWATARRRNANFHAEMLEALVVGDPQPQSEGTPPLPGARDEAVAISTLISQVEQNHVSTLLGETATHANVVDMLRKRDSALSHVHFACHGFADLTNPQTSGMLLAHSTRLVMHDVLTVALLAKLRLVVLSACRTALVGTELPDEVVGLPSAWLQAGARDVLASLWPVSDNVTFIFMAKFYELHLLDRLEPTEAFWLTQRWLRRLPTWREDFRAMGAERAALGAEANMVVPMLAPSRGAMELADHAEWVGDEAESKLLERKDQGEERTEQEGDTTQLPGRWADPYHWAAFAIYGA
jgi:CHAT domain-containing protein/tetratricopeptide (TPR) repeat protein